MHVISDEAQWAQMTFGQARLGDARRTTRLVRLATALAVSPELSVDAACMGDKAAAEGAHRLMRNDAVKAQSIAEAGFEATAKLAEETTGWILAIEDTTTLSFTHSVAGQLGDMGGVKDARAQGWWVHSVLLAEAESRAPIGLIDQERWSRPAGKRGQKHRRKDRPYTEKESYKWEKASRRIAERVTGEVKERLVSVCDRESDVFEYLAYKTENAGRFVARAAWDRGVENAEETKLWEHANSAEVLGERQVVVTQRGGKFGRKARTTSVEVAGRAVRLKAPQRKVGPKLAAIDIWLVYARETTPEEGQEPLEWLLLTDFEVDSFERADQVLGCYETRWLIEDFHKAWKSGVKVEERRQQEAQNLEKVAVVTAFVAVRLLQIRSLAACAPDTSCSEIFSNTEWFCLWTSTEQSPPPNEPPTVRWAWLALAKLGGWRDTQRTGRPGWLTMWRGWSRLEQRVAGFELALRFHQHFGDVTNS
jgi:hypothetical protein